SMVATPYPCLLCTQRATTVPTASQQDSLLRQPRRFKVQPQLIDKRVPLDVVPHRMEERGVGEAGQVERVGQVALQLRDGLGVRRWLRRRAPLLEQPIHPRIAVARPPEASGR